MGLSKRERERKKERKKEREKERKKERKIVRKKETNQYESCHAILARYFKMLFELRFEN